MIKYYLQAILPALFFIPCAALSQSKHKLEISKVTVFLKGAELESTTKLWLNKGENEMIFTNVASDVDKASMVVSASNGIVVESSVFKESFIDSVHLSTRLKHLKDSLMGMNDQIAKTEQKIGVLDADIALLGENMKVGGEQNGVSPVEFQKVLDYSGAKMESDLNQKHDQQRLLAKLKEKAEKISTQIDEEEGNGEDGSGGQLVVKFYAKEACNSDINISYVVNNAGWSPTYDIWASDKQEPLKIFYKANLHQECGIDWKNVKLTLSTGNPNESMQSPELQPKTLVLESQPLLKAVTITAYNKKSKEMDKAPSAAIGTAATLSANATYNWSETTLNEVVAVSNTGVNTSFDIDLPYNITGDGQNHLVSVKKYDAAASYTYVTVPSLNPEAFLEAHITNWADLNLLPGSSNIFYDNSYIGEASINPANTRDTLDLSLGRDKKIIVKKEVDKKLRSKKFIGSNISESESYNITVRNTRKDNVTIKVKDQIPVSDESQITIEDVDTGGAQLNDQTGELNWELSLAPNESKTVHFGFTKKYPKNKALVSGR